jgi:hypothetical protein
VRLLAFVPNRRECATLGPEDEDRFGVRRFIATLARSEPALKPSAATSVAVEEVFRAEVRAAMNRRNPRWVVA